jgi:hypothetical protein
MSENGTEFKNGRMVVHNDDHVVGQHIKSGCECGAIREIDF